VVFKQRPQRLARLTLRLPLIALVLGFTAVPIELQSPTRESVATALKLNLDALDIVANILGYVPFGIIFAYRGPWVALGISTTVSLLAEVSQLFSASRSSDITDVAANVLGAVVGLLVTSRWKPEWEINTPWLTISRHRAAIAAALALAYLAFGARVTPVLVEDTLTRVLKTPRVLWLDVNPRGATEPGRLEGHWTFDGPLSEVAIDRSGNALNGALVNGPVLVKGIDGQSLTLNGVNQYVDLGDPTALRLTGSETITAWINARSFPMDDAAVVSDYSGLGYQLDTTVDRGPRAIGFKLANASGQRMIRYGRTPIALNTWYHIAGVYDAQTQTLNVYLNGKNDNGCLVGTVTNRQHVSGMNAYIGRRADLAGFEFDGSIDDVRIFSRALAQSEIEAEFNATEGAESLAVAAEAAVQHSDSTCPSTEVADSRKSGLVVTLGVLVAVGILGFVPTVSRSTLLLVSFALGFLLFPSLDLTLPAGYKWLIPLLTLAGGASVGFSRSCHAAQS
jgi:VanZ family protein